MPFWFSELYYEEFEIWQFKNSLKHNFIYYIMRILKFDSSKNIK